MTSTHVALGRTGIKVSRLCYGTMSFGGDADEAMAAKLFNRCRDAGINFFDCANVYSAGKAETILGNLIQGSRDELVLTTKVFSRMGEDVNTGGLSRRHITRAVEDSLRRLKTDRIEVYFCHMFDPAVPMEETLAALTDLVRAGKVLHPAISNWAAWQIEKALGLSALHGFARPAVLQPMYNLVKRQAEVEILPMAKAEGLGVIPYSPLGGGLLTGKYADGAKPAAGRIVGNAMYAKRYEAGWQYGTAEKLLALAQARGLHPATLAVGWVMGHAAVTAPIIGARNLEQLEPSLAALDLDMSPALRAEISALSVDPGVATDRSEEGRPA